MTDSSVLSFIPQDSAPRALSVHKSAFGGDLITEIRPVMIFLSMESRFYKAEKTFSAKSTTREYLPNVRGKIQSVALVNPKDVQRVNIQGVETNDETGEIETWIISLSVDGQEHYRALLPKLKVVNLPEQSLVIQPKLGHTATFMDVFVNGDQNKSVYAISLDKSDDALNETVNDIRYQLGLQPQYPEWLNLRTDPSPTQSVPTSSETCSDEPESSSQSQI